jgi:hypothetical protein
LQEAKKEKKLRRKIKRRILSPIHEFPEHMFPEDDQQLLSDPSKGHSLPAPSTGKPLPIASKQISLFDSFNRKKLELKPKVEAK